MVSPRAAGGAKRAKATARDGYAFVEASEIRSRVAHALNAVSRIVLIRSTTGSGKTAKLLEIVVASEQRTGIFVPTHALADQSVTTLTTLGAKAQAKKGVAAIRGEDGQPYCVDTRRAEALSVLGGDPRMELCHSCPSRERHPSGGPCPAYEQRTPTAQVHVFQRVVADRVLASSASSATTSGSATASVEVDDAPAHEPITLAILDEPPSIIKSLPIKLGEVDIAKLEFEGLREDCQVGLKHAIELAASALAKGGVPSGCTFRELLSLAAKGGAAEVDDAIKWACEVEAVTWSSAHRQRLVMALRGEDTDRTCAKFTAAAKIVSALLEGAHRPDVPFAFLVQGRDGPERQHLVHFEPWVRAARGFARGKGRIILADATADEQVLRAALGDLDVVDIHVRDAPGVKRAWVKWGSAARSQHANKPGHIRGCLRDLAARVRARKTKHVGIITDKPTAECIRVELEARGAGDAEYIPTEMLQLVTDGVGFSVGHFGAVRGLNHWEDCGVLAVVGEDWVNIGVGGAEAATLGIDPVRYTRRKLQEELTQAEGRARAVHRTTPVLIVRYTNLAPDLSLAPQWAGVQAERLLIGRPRATGRDGVPLSAEGWDVERARLGLSKRAHARLIGIAWETYRRYANGPAQKCH